MNQIQKNNYDVAPKSATKQTIPMKKPLESKVPPKVIKPGTLKSRPQTSIGIRSPVTTSNDSEPWSNRLLTNRSNEKVSIFNNFDPLRTLHFLTKELQIRIQTVLPDDSSLQQMVSDIQIALKRVPPEVTSLLHWQQAYEIKKPTKEEKPVRLKVEKVDKSVQTPPLLTGEDTEKIKKFVEKNTLKLETTCKEMEQLCNLYQREKENLLTELENEKEITKNLNSKLMECKIKMDELLEAKRSMKAKYEQEIENKVEPMKFDASLADLAKLKAQKAQLNEDLNALKQKYTILEIEKERFATLLTLRDGEIAEYRNEIEQLQCNFLKLDGELASCLLENQAGDATISTIMSNSEHNFRELPSGDGLGTSDTFQDALQGCGNQRNVATPPTNN